MHLLGAYRNLIPFHAFYPLPAHTGEGRERDYRLSRGALTIPLYPQTLAQCLVHTRGLVWTKEEMKMLHNAYQPVAHQTSLILFLFRYMCLRQYMPCAHRTHRHPSVGKWNYSRQTSASQCGRCGLSLGSLHKQQGLLTRNLLPSPSQASVLRTVG